MKVLSVETFAGGSHAAFADGLVRHSRHQFTMATLPARNWRLRTRTGAFEIAHAVPDPSGFDLLFVTDLISLSDLIALWRSTVPPILLYHHESQPTYPFPKGRNPDFDLVMRDIRNALVADRVVFNSQFHRNAFLDQTAALAERLCDADGDVAAGWSADIAARSSVLYPGIEVQPAAARPERVPRILWNHRWEYDKRPAAFFRALAALQDEGVPFELVVVGENPQEEPKGFLEARERFADRIVQWGYAESVEDYRRWLAESDIVVSTAKQENFGIAVVEAMRSGCVPLLPRRLSYPELIPEELHPDLLYERDRELPALLKRWIAGPRDACAHAVSSAMARFDWKVLAPAYDALMDETAVLRERG